MFGWLKNPPKIRREKGGKIRKALESFFSGVVWLPSQSGVIRNGLHKTVCLRREEVVVCVEAVNKEQGEIRKKLGLTERVHVICVKLGETGPGSS